MVYVIGWRNQQFSLTKQSFRDVELGLGYNFDLIMSFCCLENANHSPLGSGEDVDTALEYVGIV